MRIEASFNPGSFGRDMGGLDGMTAALSGREVATLIAQGFLRYGQDRAFEGVDTLARTLAGASDSQRGKLRYAYEGGSPENIGVEEHRLFESSEVEYDGIGWSIGVDYKEDYTESWSPVTLKYYEYQYIDRMSDAVAKDSGTRFKAKGGYAVGRDDNGEVIYSKHFRYDFGKEYGEYADFEGVVERQWAAIERNTEAEVGAGVKSAITKSVNKLTGNAGQRGVANSILTGYTDSYGRGLRLMNKFMLDEMQEFIGRGLI